MMSFFPVDEFESQVEELVELGYSRQVAVEMVRREEAEAELEYNQWREEQAEIARQEEMYAEQDDNWYDEQYELEADYY
jgi:hypothetical protein